MMGVPLSPEQAKAVNDAVQERKAKVAASLGQTLEEFDAAQHAHIRHNHDDDLEDLDALADGLPDIDEEAVMAFITSRQDLIAKQRGRIKLLEARVKHARAQNDIAENKIAALRKAMEAIREENKALKARLAAMEHPAGEPAAE